MKTMGMFDESNQPPSGGMSGDGGLIGAAIQLGGSLYDSAQNRKTSKENTDKTIAASKSEAELAYQRQMQMWYENNQYNSPAAQMARFKAAGLNPNLIYGNGTAGNSNSIPQYQPANMQYKYEAPAYGAAVGGVLPTLMAVGTWMQNMRLSEAELSKKTSDTDRVQQLIDYMRQANPKMLESLENKNSMYPYQSQMMASQKEAARLKLWEVGQEFKYKYGEDLFRDSGAPGSDGSVGGVRKLQFMQEAAKTRLAQAKSSWTDFNITDPQQIMQMVMQGVLGLAGQTLRLSSGRGTFNKNRRHVTEVEERLRNGRTKIRRSIHE
jgi:hypothetical protein